MNWVFKEGVPLYTQIVDELLMGIARGEYAPGDKLPSVRDLAVEAGVNPNTMQRAYQELERQGYVHAERTSGRFVTEDKDLLEVLRLSLTKGVMEGCRAQLRRIGLSREEIADTMARWAKEE